MSTGRILSKTGFNRNSTKPQSWVRFRFPRHPFTMAESMENGDKNYYRYEFTGISKNGAFESGSNKWSMTEGGGKMKGGKASGTCTAKGNADGSTSFDCMGTYAPAAK